MNALSSALLPANNEWTMQGKIALEEHFAVDDTVMDSAPLVQGDHWTELKSRLLDLHGRRIDLMDRHGIERMILSLNAPAVQAIPNLKRANEVARRANDILAAEVAKRPDRFSAFAALPMQDADLAIRELERCMQLGLQGGVGQWLLPGGRREHGPLL